MSQGSQWFTQGEAKEKINRFVEVSSAVFPRIPKGTKGKVLSVHPSEPVGAGYGVAVNLGAYGHHPFDKTEYVGHLVELESVDPSLLSELEEPAWMRNLNAGDEYIDGVGIKRTVLRMRIRHS
ncbi:MAG: hypothetical protein AAB916_01455 [Patescibacteria group bacterium]